MFQEMKPPLYHLPQNIHEPGSAAAIKQEKDDAEFKVQCCSQYSNLRLSTSIIFYVVQHIRSGNLKFHSFPLLKKPTSQHFPPNCFVAQTKQTYECKYLVATISRHDYIQIFSGTCLIQTSLTQMYGQLKNVYQSHEFPILAMQNLYV